MKTGLEQIYKRRLKMIDELFKNIDYGDLKLFFHSSSLETDFSGLIDPIAFPYCIKNVKYQ